MFERHEMFTIEGALSVALEEYKKNREQFLALADRLRAGESFPLFADGEDGARAAERLAQRFEQQHDSCVELLEVMADGELVR